MKYRLSALLFVILLLFSVMTPAAYAETPLSADQIVDLAITELKMDDYFAASDKLLDSRYYRTIVHHWPNPALESVRGESWYVRFDAIDKANDSSYVVALHEDGELAFLDVAPSEEWQKSLGTVGFLELLDRYQEVCGMMPHWNQAQLMSFAVEVSKGMPDTRNAWRFQHAVFIPVPQGAISKEEAGRLAAQAADLPVEAAIICVCQLDGDRVIYKVSLGLGSGWLSMVELDCMTGEILLVTPFDHDMHGWTDCYIPQSLMEQVPPAESFLPSNG